MPKVNYKERLLKAAREKQLVTYKGADFSKETAIKLATDFSKETMQDRRAWHKISKVMETKDLQPKTLYPASLSFRIEGQIKSYPDKNKPKEFFTTKPVLQEM